MVGFWIGDVIMHKTNNRKTACEAYASFWTNEVVSQEKQRSVSGFVLRSVEHH